jgi:hypothetical protein
MEDKIKAALANIDKIVSSASMGRQEHLVLVQNIELLTNVCKDHLQLLKNEEDKKDEPTK